MLDDKFTRTKSTRKKNDEIENTQFKPNCIFCGKDGVKNIKKKCSWTTEKLICFEPNNWQKVVDMAEMKGDETILLRIRGYDLHACGSKYHPSCKRKHMVNPIHWRSSDRIVIENQKEMELAHEQAFQDVSLLVKDQIIDKHEVHKLSEFKKIYIDALEKTDFPNNQYRSENFKLKLEKKFPGKICFLKMNCTSKFGTYLIYSSSLDISFAIESAYRLGTADTITDVALSLRNTVKETFSSKGPMDWPPSQEYLQNNNTIPDDLATFLSILLTGMDDNLSDRDTRHLLSVGQDICRMVTNYEWKFPKHIILLMTFRHLF